MSAISPWKRPAPVTWRAAPVPLSSRAVQAIRRGAAVSRLQWSWHWTVGALAALLILRFFDFYFDAGKTTIFNDGAAKLNLARRVFDNAHGQFSLAQLGGVWLPLMSALETTTVWIDSFYQTGLSGSIISMASFVALTVILFEIGRTLTGRVMGGLAAVCTVALNLNLILFGTSTMAEMLLMAMMALCALSLIKLEQTVERDPHSLRWLVIAAAAFGILCITRYEGYFLTGGAVPLLGLALWRRGVRGHHLVATIGTIFVVPAFFVASWLLYQLAIFGNPLHFATSKYSAHAIDVVGFGIDYSVGDVGAASRNFLFAVRWNFEDPLLVLAVAGAALYVARWSLGRERMLTPLFLAGIPLFYVISLYQGQMALDPNPINPYNVRYGLTTGVTLAVAIGYLAGTLIPRGMALRRAGILAAASVLATVVAISLPLWREPLANTEILADSGARLPDGTIEMAAWLEENYQGGRILMGAWLTAHVQFESGIPLNRFLTEASPAMWQEALADPAAHTEWVYIAYMPGDVVQQRMAELPTFDEEFVLIYETPAGAIYLARTELGDEEEFRS